MYPASFPKSAIIDSSLPAILVVKLVRYGGWMLTVRTFSFTPDEDLYAAAPLYLDGTSLQFRRQAGRQNKLWMHDLWITGG